MPCSPSASAAHPRWRWRCASPWRCSFRSCFSVTRGASVNREQPQWLDGPPAAAGGLPLSDEQLAVHSSDDASAGCAMGVAVVLVLLFGLAMAIATIVFAIGTAA